MMDVNLIFTVTNDYDFGAQWPSGSRVFLPTNKTFEGICLALARKCLQRSCEFFCIWNHSVKKVLNVVWNLFMNMSAK